MEEEFQYQLLTVDEQRGELTNRLRQLERQHYVTSLDMKTAQGAGVTGDGQIFEANLKTIEAKIAVMRDQMSRLTVVNDAAS